MSSILLRAPAGRELLVVAVTIAQLDQTDPVPTNRQREPAVLQCQCVLAKDLAAPSGKSPHRSLVVGGDGIEIVGAGQQLLRDLMLLAALLPQDPQQLDQRAR